VARFSNAREKTRAIYCKRGASPSQDVHVLVAHISGSRKPRKADASEACSLGDLDRSGLTGVGLHGSLEVGCHDLLELSEGQAVDVEATRAVGPRGQLAVPVAAQPTVLARRLLEPDQLPCRRAEEGEGGGELVRVQAGYLFIVDIAGSI
jgi:hypothetical protein